MPKRGERAIPPVPPDGWTVRFVDRAVALGWRDLCTAAAGSTWHAWMTLTLRPTQPENRARHHRLRLTEATQVIQGETLEQWQYEVTAGGRIWFCPEPKTRTVWITYASTRHPKANE